MADLSRRIGELAARAGGPALRPEPPASPPGPAAGPTAPIEALLALPVDRFAEAGQCLEISVPWASQRLWFVPTEADVKALAQDGIHRGQIWTVGELHDLLAIPGLTKAQARTIAETKLVFAGDVVAVESLPAAGAGAGHDAPRVSPGRSGWPAAVPGLGPKEIGPLTSCGVCGVGTWVVYSNAARCRACAAEATTAAGLAGSGHAEIMNGVASQPRPPAWAGSPGLAPPATRTPPDGPPRPTRIARHA